MPELRGNVSRRDLEEYVEYNGADSTLIDLLNEGTDSGRGGTAGGTGSFTWKVTWDETGFTGEGWLVNGRDFSNYTDEQIKAQSFTIAVAMTASFHPCGSLVPN